MAYKKTVIVYSNSGSKKKGYARKRKPGTGRSYRRKSYRR